MWEKQKIQLLTACTSNVKERENNKKETYQTAFEQEQLGHFLVVR